MRKTYVSAISGAALAAGILLAGCNLSPAQLQDAAKAALSAAQSDLGKQLTNQLVSSLQSYVDVEAGQALADQAGGLSTLLEGFSVQALPPKPLVPIKPGDIRNQLPTNLKDKLPPMLKDGAPADFLKEVKAPPPRFDQAKQRLEGAMKNKLGDLSKVKPEELKKKYVDMAKGKIENVRKDVAKRVDTRINTIKEKFDPTKDFQTVQGTASLDPFGEVFFVSATMSLKVKDMAKTHTFDRYYLDNDGTKVLVQVVDHTSQTFKNGASHTADRTRTNYEDGSYEVTFDTSATKGGKTHSVSWTRKGSSDGSETGTGTITRGDGSKTDVTFTKDSSGKTVSSSTDSATKTKVEVSQTEGSSDATVVVADTSDPTKKTTETVNSADLEPELK